MSITAVSNQTPILSTPKAPAAKPATPKAEPWPPYEPDKLSVGEKVLRGTGATVLGAMGGALSGGGAGLLLGEILITGDKSGALGYAAAGGMGGAVFGFIAGGLVGQLVENKSTGTLLGAAAGAAVGAIGSVVLNGGSFNAKDMLAMAGTGAAAGASSGFISAALQRKN